MLVKEFTSQTEYVMKDGDTQITGEVTEIVGNEVTLALGEVTEGSRKENDDMEIPEGGLGNGEMPEGGF